MAKRTSTYGWLAVLAGLVLLTLAGLLVVVRPWTSTDSPAAPAAVPTLGPPPAAVLAGVGDVAPPPTTTGLAATLDGLVGHELGERVGLVVVDVLTGEPLYRQQGDRAIVPASTTKLVTAAATLATLAPADRLVTVAVAGAEPGEVVLVGGGDPTLAVDAGGFYPGAARLDQLAAQVEAALAGQAVRRVIVDATRYTGPVHGPWDADIPTGGYVGPVTALMTDGGRIDPDPAQGHRASARYQDPDLAAGEEFARLLGADPKRVERGTAPASTGQVHPAPAGTPTPPAAAEPPGGERTGRHRWPAAARNWDGSLSAAAVGGADAGAQRQRIAEVRPGKWRWPAACPGRSPEPPPPWNSVGSSAYRWEPRHRRGHAGGRSGLSRKNLLTADLLTALRRAATATPDDPLAGVVAGLPVAGWSGTLSERYRTGADDSAPAVGAGVVRAKTGTLYGVHALAGLVVTADGRWLAFAILADQVPVGDELARQHLDAIAAALAGCGCGGAPRADPVR